MHRLSNARPEARGARVPSARRPAPRRRTPVPISPAAFQALLQSEQACLDRHGHAFSLIHVEFARVESVKDRLPRLVRHAAAVLRSTDLIARTGTERVTVLLPFAGRERAQEVARLLLAEDGAPAADLTCTIECRTPAAVRPRTAPPKPRVLAPMNPGALPPGLSWEERGVSALLCRALPRWKRVLDVCLASAGLVLLLPVMLVIALAILALHGGPVIYRQWRTGQGFRRFRIYKFRTMRRGSGRGWADLQHLNEMDGPLFKASDDPRVLRLGRLLRKSSLDELPQLWNVIKGDMTLIGPRALSPEPGEYETWQLRRFDLRPGIACSWQAERRSDTDFEEWMRSDLRYVDQGSSFAGDLRLLLTTVRGVIRWVGSR